MDLVLDYLPVFQISNVQQSCYWYLKNIYCNLYIQNPWKNSVYIINHSMLKPFSVPMYIVYTETLCIVLVELWKTSSMPVIIEWKSFSAKHCDNQVGIYYSIELLEQHAEPQLDYSIIVEAFDENCIKVQYREINQQ